MARPPSRHPTELELEILKILWQHGPATVRQVREHLAAVRQSAYTSVMTIMNIMVKKGHLQRDKRGASYVYYHRTSQQATVRRILGDLTDRLFSGSAASLMLNLLETAEIDPNELEKLRELINRKTKEQSP